MLVAWEELSHAEIGQVLGISPNASAIRVHRARKRLQPSSSHS
ncbi:RNA polymerase sigma factor [Candidatus Poriferisodalis sp.]